MLCTIMRFRKSATLSYLHALKEHAFDHAHALKEHNCRIMVAPLLATLMHGYVICSNLLTTY